VCVWGGGRRKGETTCGVWLCVLGGGCGVCVLVCKEVVVVVAVVVMVAGGGMRGVCGVVQGRARKTQACTCC
jgi:hypothetical protein